ncbi:MAG: YjgP/YjgQ family permease [Epsilonproteobacteria bacterium]|nr:YjgP/YjgQ family permease [Campylobacterota bacterium]
MELIDRYLYKSYLFPFLLSLLAISTILVLGNFAKYFSVIFAPGADPVSILKLTAYITIFTLFYAVPMSHLTGMFLLFSYLAANNEFIVMRTSGITFTRIIKPVLIISVAIFIIEFIINFYALPYSKGKYKATLFDITKTTIAESIKEKIFYNRIPNLVIYADYIDRKGALRNLFVERKNKKTKSIIFAGHGRLFSLKNSLFFKIYSGTIFNPDKEILENFSSMNLKIENFKPFLQTDIASNPSYMNLGKLIRYRATSNKEKLHFKIFINKHIASILSVFIFSIIGMCLGIHLPRSGKSGAYGISLLLFVIYYIILIFSGKAANSLGIAQLMWLPDIIFLIIAMVLAKITFEEISLEVFRKRPQKVRKR